MPNALTTKVPKYRSGISSAAVEYSEAVQSTSAASVHAERADALMQQVREPGYLPRESQYPKERSLAHDLREPHAPVDGFYYCHYGYYCNYCYCYDVCAWTPNIMLCLQLG